MVSVKVESLLFNCILNLERRITYIRGLSATGKTSLVEYIDQYNDGNDSVRIICDRDVEVIRNIKSKDTFLPLAGKVVFIDDRLVTETSYLNSNTINSVVENDVYLVIINRVDSKVKTEDLKVNFSVSSILNCKCSGVNHWFVQDCNESCEDDDFNNIRCECIIAEDKYGSCDFSKSVFGGIPVISSKGKDSILIKVDEAVNNGYKNIYVFVDCADFGRKFHNFRQFCSTLKGVNVYLDTDYECFEYLLLLSNILNKEFTFSEDEANTYSSWESYCEAKIEEITKGKMYSYRHGSKVKGCYRKECDSVCNSYKSSKCDKYVIEDKIPYMFRNTIFDYLISMRDNLK